MTRFRLILFCMLASGAAVAAMGAQRRYPISTAQIAATMDRMGIEIAPSQVTLLTEVVATTTAPRLRVRSIEPWGDQQMRARLECDSADECLPFFVGLRVNGAQQAADAAPAPAAPVTAGSPRTFAMKNGDEAILRLDSERVHIRLSVICLENGTLGQTIRVTTKDRKMTYHAQVIDGTTLQGRL
jgi:hypothetical protein